MKFIFVFAVALTLTAQQQRYSSKPVPVDGKSKSTTRVKNAIEFTPDGIFLQQAALDNAFVIEFARWAKTHGENAGVRSTAVELDSLETKFGDDLRKLAARKHVALPDKPSDPDMQGIYSDREFVQQLLRRYDQEMVTFDREGRAGSDPDIRSFAAGGVETLQKHRRHVETLEERTRN